MTVVSATKAATASAHANRSQATQLHKKQQQCEQLQQQAQQDRKILQEVRNQNRLLRAECESLNNRMASLLADDPPPQNSSLLTRERPLPGHQFGVHLIALCIELAKRVGFRSTQFVLQEVFDALELDIKVPSHDAIEQWTLRLGVSELKDTFTKDQRVLWMADHSSQIGKEKVLLIIGIALEDLPAPGETLDLNKMKVLAIVPGRSWKKEDVGRQYQLLARRIGAPVYLICDGALELSEPAEKLQKDGKNTVILRDLKHVAANALEKHIGHDEQFQSFMTEVGLARNRVQQTELGHLSPPKVKPKSRFMNLGPLLLWAMMIRYFLDHPEAQARDGVTVERMEEKFGWLREYDAELSQWKACQDVIDKSLHLINHEGLHQKSTAEMTSALAPWLSDEGPEEAPASKIAKGLLALVKSSQENLHEGERAWLSTEILESLFGRFKQLEGQHSKSGFTRLVAAIPTLCRKVTGPAVREGFRKVNSKRLKRWIKKKIPRSLASRRNLASREYRTALAPK